MRKDRLVLILLLSVFALMGADCRLISEKEDREVRLPDRAPAANPLLRTYFSTITTPAGMSERDTSSDDEDDWIDVRIPEDKDLIKKDGPLSLAFDMGGGATVNDVRCRLRIAPPKSGQGANCEVQCRIRAPNGVRSGWKDVDFATDTLIDPQVEVVFLNEFDGFTSDGAWLIELQDSVDDNDGRCLFRNATLRINLGEPTAGGGANETATLALGSSAYTYIPEMVGSRDKGDWGDFGMQRPLRVPFVFANAPFRVRSFALRISVLINQGVGADEDLYAIIVAPSGGWLSFRLTADLALETLDLGGPKLVTYDIAADSAAPFGESFFFRGEPSNGVWTLALWDTKVDSNIAYLSKDAVAAGPAANPNSAATLTLAGVT
jgi:hypothetical protein